MTTLVEIKNSGTKPVRRIGSLACGLGLALSLAACGNTGADYQPILDGTPSAYYSADLAACQQVAEQRSYLNDNVKSEAALGAGLGALVGAADEGIEGAIAGAVVGGLRWSGLFGQLFNQLRWNPAVVVGCGDVGNALALSIISTAPAAPAKTSVGVR